MLHRCRWILCVAGLFLVGPPGQGADQSGAPSCYFPVPDNQETWRLLPKAVKGEGEPLPAWARVMARTLPATTAAMLELDYLHRAGSPLDTQLRGKMRWVAAHANRCAYSEACALEDLKRAGLDEKALATLQLEQEKLPRKDSLP